MGEEAEKLDTEVQDLETPETEVVDEVVEGGEEDGELEVILEGDTHTQDEQKSSPKGFQKRIGRFNRRLTEKDQEIAELQQRIAGMAQPVQTALTAMPLPPTEESTGFDGEVFKVAQAQYVQDMTLWNQNQINLSISQSNNGLKLQQQARTAEKSISKHYENAGKLGANDFDQTEDAAVEILGDALAKEIIARTGDKSAAIMYYLGKNEAKAFELKDALENDPTEATMLVGELRANVKVQRKRKSQAPDPETKVEGQPPKGQSTLQRALEAAREEAGQTGDMRAVMKVKRDAKAQGITLE